MTTRELLDSCISLRDGQTVTSPIDGDCYHRYEASRRNGVAIARECEMSSHAWETVEKWTAYIVDGVLVDVMREV